MAASNTVEAVLRSRFEDGVNEAVNEAGDEFAVGGDQGLLSFDFGLLQGTNSF